MKCVFVSIAAVVGSLALAGCHQPLPPQPGMVDPVATTAYPTVSVEPALQKFLVIGYDGIVACEATPTATMHIAVPVRSTALQQYLIQYQFSYFNEAGFPLGQSGWRMLAMEPGMRRVLEGSALTEDAERWLLEIRSSR